MKLPHDTEFEPGLYCITFKRNSAVTVIEDPELIKDDSGTYCLKAKTISLDHIGDSGQTVLIDPEELGLMAVVTESRVSFMQEIGRRRTQSQDLETVINLRRLVETGVKAGVIAEPPKVGGPPDAPVGTPQAPMSGREKAPSPAKPAVPAPPAGAAPNKPFAAETVPAEPVIQQAAPEPIQMVEEEDYQDGTVVEIPPPGQ